LNTVFEPPIFSAVLIDQALISKVSMAMGSMTVDDAAYGVFEARVFSSVSAIAASRSKGVTAEHLVKIWRIPHDDAARTLEVTTQRIWQDPDSSLSHNARTNDQAVRYRRISSKFSRTRSLQQRWPRVCVEILVLRFLSRTKILLHCTCIQ
jgi:hypothetical protein